MPLMAKDVWARIKLDAIVHEDETSARVIDYKTGRQFGNEIAHDNSFNICNRFVFALSKFTTCANRVVVFRSSTVTEQSTLEIKLFIFTKTP